MVKNLTESEFVNIVKTLTDTIAIPMRNEEGEPDTMTLMSSDFNGGCVLYEVPYSSQTGILQDNRFGDIEENARELYKDIEECGYTLIQRVPDVSKRKTVKVEVEIEYEYDPKHPNVARFGEEYLDAAAKDLAIRPSCSVESGVRLIHVCNREEDCWWMIRRHT